MTCPKCQEEIGSMSMHYCPLIAEMPAKEKADDRLALTPCSALSDALTLVKCSPRKSEDAQVWWDAASTMTKHCRGLEDVTEAAARILVERIEDLEADNAIYRDRCEKHKIVIAKVTDSVAVLNDQKDAETMLKRLGAILLPNDERIRGDADA